MKTEWYASRVAQVMVSWPFLVCLATLLANDWWLKSAFPGALTGKLSDFAGIALVGLLAMAKWPKRIALVAMTIAAAFSWWKSPYSQVVIEWANTITPLHIGRTIDYTDIVALCVLPFCPHFVNYADRHSLVNSRIGRALRIPLVAATAFAIMGTTFMPTRDTYSVRRTSSSITLQQDRVAEAIAEAMKQQGLECVKCTNSTERAMYSGHGLSASYVFQGADAVSFEIFAMPDGLFGATGKEKADALRTALKSVLAERFSGLEYVEPLKPKRER